MRSSPRDSASWSVAVPSASAVVAAVAEARFIDDPVLLAAAASREASLLLVAADALPSAGVGDKDCDEGSQLALVLGVVALAPRRVLPALRDRCCRELVNAGRASSPGEASFGLDFLALDSPSLSDSASHLTICLTPDVAFRRSDALIVVESPAWKPSRQSVDQYRSSVSSSIACAHGPGVRITWQPARFAWAVIVLCYPPVSA
mgnify:CR=1 FL=1